MDKSLEMTYEKALEIVLHHKSGFPFEMELRGATSVAGLKLVYKEALLYQKKKGNPEDTQVIVALYVCRLQEMS